MQPLGERRPSGRAAQMGPIFCMVDKLIKVFGLPMLEKAAAGDRHTAHTLTHRRGHRAGADHVCKLELRRSVRRERPPSFRQLCLGS